MEFENIGNTYAGFRIADIIRSKWVEDTRAVVVLLGKSLQNPPSPQYTHNWVNFEVGVSAGCQKPVWVFENFNEFINYPVPYVTDYCLYELENSEHLRFIGDIFKTKYVSQTVLNAPNKIKCPLCNAEYGLWSTLQSVNCPVCRRSFALS